MCFDTGHTQIHHADFGQILSRRRVQKVAVTSQTDGPIFANLVSQDAYDLKEKSHEKACRDDLRSRRSRGFCRGGGGQIDPPPLGLIKMKLFAMG